VSKVRRDKHKDLVNYQIFAKMLDRYSNWHSSAPRWRQSSRAEWTLLIRGLKND